MYQFDVSRNHLTVAGEVRVALRSQSLEFTLLGLLANGPLHGYELRKRSLTILGPFRALSFGSLYPLLKRLADGGLIQVIESNNGKSRRTRIAYQITKSGLKRFEELTETLDATEDEAFGVHFAFFGPTSHTNRVRILEARRRRLREKADLLRHELERSPIGLDKYFIEWRHHSLESAEREIAWLDEMIKAERKSQ
jgi:DNA-binding PadR family transcriptional regulator